MIINLGFDRLRYLTRITKVICISDVILHEYLGISKFCARMVPRLLDHRSKTHSTEHLVYMY